MTHIAYCYASGQIKIGETVPSGAIAFARGPEDGLTKLLERTARLAYDNETWLVPGVPEADDQREGMDALLIWGDWIKGRDIPGVTVEVEI